METVTPTAITKLGPSVADVHIPTAMSDALPDEEEAKLKAALLDLIVEKSDSELIITKASAEKRLAYGIVYRPGSPDSLDSQGDFASAAEIENFAHEFMAKSRNYDLQHMVDLGSSRATIVESYIAPCDFMLGDKSVAKGSWIAVTRFDPELWQMVKAGQIRAYSIFGKGKRIPVT